MSEINETIKAIEDKLEDKPKGVKAGRKKTIIKSDPIEVKLVDSEKSINKRISVNEEIL